MSCHAASLLTELLKEQVLLCERGLDGASRIYGLKNVKGIRRDEDFQTRYLGGEYGGVPTIG